MAAPMNGIEVNKLRKKCTKLLGKGASKHLIPILLDILSVSCGLKPSFIYDYTHIRAVMLREFVQELRTDGIIAQTVPLAVVSIDEDTLLCNVASLRTLSQTLKQYIDVSSELKSPHIVSTDVANAITNEYMNELSDIVYCKQNDDTVDSVVDQHIPSKHQNSSLLLLELQLPQRVNRTTMYGLLLGYPVIYWYKTENISDSSQISVCLDYVPLKVYKVSAKWKWTERAKHTVYSFSCPEELSINAKDAIQNWFSDMKQVDISEHFVDVSLEINNVILPTVSL